MDKCYVFSDRGGDRVLVGLLEHQPTQMGALTYARSYLESAAPYPLDPVNLPLGSDRYTISSKPFLPGVVLDAGPDDWGRKNLLYQGRPADGLYPLIFGSGSGVGSLLFSLSRDRVKPRPAAPSLDDLEQLLEGANDIEKGEAPPPHIAKLFDAGTSMGGARPKAVVEDAGRLWLAKFPSRSDVLDQPACEYASLSLARKAEITVPDHRLVPVAGRNVLLVARFDAIPNQQGAFIRSHYISMSSLLVSGRRLRPSDDKGGYSYMGLSTVLAQHSWRHEKDRLELFDRMVFNVLLGHVDDHSRNHGLLLRPGQKEYELAPAFDIAPSDGNAESVSRRPLQQAIGIGRRGAVRSVENLLSAAKDFALTPALAQERYQAVKAVVKEWKEHFVTAGLSDQDVARIQHRVFQLPEHSPPEEDFKA